MCGSDSSNHRVAPTSGPRFIVLLRYTALQGFALSHAVARLSDRLLEEAGPHGYRAAVRDAAEP